VRKEVADGDSSAEGLGFDGGANGAVHDHTQGLERREGGGRTGREGGVVRQTKI